MASAAHRVHPQPPLDRERAPPDAPRRSGARPLADEHGVELRDLRRPPDDLDCPTGANLEVDAPIVLTVGSDCAIGKMTVSLELDRAARARGIASVFVPTGQTGIAIAGWGIAVDAVVADFLAGAAERLVVEGRRARGRAAVRRGSGRRSSIRPTRASRSASSTGRRRTLLVLCHRAGATEVEGYPGHPLPSLSELVALHERASLPRRQARVVAVALNTPGLGRRRPPPLRSRRLPRRLACRPQIRSATVRRRCSTPCSRRRRDPVASAPAPVGGVSELATNGVCGGWASRGWGGRLRALAAGVICALAVVGPAAAADIGANDDTGKYAPDAGAAFYAEMASLGLRQAVVTVRWQPSDPLGLAERPLLDLTVAAARSAGLEVVFATYPYPPREIESGLARPEAFGAWLAELAHRYPQVRSFVVGNEPNQPAFWRPQFSKARQRSARGVRPVPRGGLRRAQGASTRRSTSSESGSRRAGTTAPWRGATSRRRPCASWPRSAPGTGRAAGIGR